MRTWLIIGLLTLAVGDPVNKQENPAQKHHEEGKQTPSPSPPPLPVVAPSTAPPTQPTAQKKENESRNEPNTAGQIWQKRFPPETWPGWGLVVVGVVAACIAIRTLRLIERQTAHAETAANAAKASADALINIERAWLVPHGFVDPAELPTRRILPVQNEELAVQIRNCGRTPAWLLEWLCKPIVTDTTDILSLLDYSAPNMDRRGIPLPENRRENFFAEWRVANPAEINDIRDGRRQLYVYGFVKYRDIFGIAVHETYFCFHYFRQRDNLGRIHEGWAVEPPEANRYT